MAELNQSQSLSSADGEAQYQQQQQNNNTNPNINSYSPSQKPAEMPSDYPSSHNNSDYNNSNSNNTTNPSDQYSNANNHSDTVPVASDSQSAEEKFLSSAEAIRRGMRLFVAASNLKESDILKWFKSYCSAPHNILIKEGYGFFEVNHESEADDILAKCNNQDFDGRRVKVERAKEKSGGGGERRSSDYGNRDRQNYSSRSRESNSRYDDRSSSSRYPSDRERDYGRNSSDNRREGGPRQQTCFICHQPSHIQRDCPYVSK